MGPSGCKKSGGVDSTKVNVAFIYRRGPGIAIGVLDVDELLRAKTRSQEVELVAGKNINKTEVVAELETS